MASRKKPSIAMIQKAGTFFRHISTFITLGVLVLLFAIAVWSVIRFKERRALGAHPAIGAVRGAVNGASYTQTAIALDHTLLSPSAIRFLGFAGDRMGGSTESVLGVATEPVSALGRWQEIRERDSYLFKQWSKKTQEYPLFADVYFRAAYYAIRLGNYKEAKTLIDNGVRLSPTSDIALALKAHIPR